MGTYPVVEAARFDMAKLGSLVIGYISSEG